MHGYHIEEFTEDEKRALAPHVTSLTSPVFALVNLPETVKGALFARYSRTHKSIRRLLLDEFSEALIADAPSVSDRTGKADSFYERVFVEYGDDSVAQLGTVHLACEQVSNVLTKILERSRLMSYLEQSTRYIDFAQQIGGKYRYFHGAGTLDQPWADEYATEMDDQFEAYKTVLAQLIPHFEAKFPKNESDTEGVWKSTIRAKALDATRGLLPAGTVSNLGMIGSGQSYEWLIMRLLAHPLPEAQQYGQMALTELRKVIPAFLSRVDREDRGNVWVDYHADRRTKMTELAKALFKDVEVGPAPTVKLVAFEPDGEIAVAAAALFPHTQMSEQQVYNHIETHENRNQIIADAIATEIGNRENRRHKPGRAFEACNYRFDIISDYGAFRDLQRHRMLSIDWQNLTPDHGYEIPVDVQEAGAAETYAAAMDRSAEHFTKLNETAGPAVAQYAVPLGYRIRYYMSMNAREAYHLCELRSSPQGHPSYRTIAQEMARQITDAHPHIGAGMTHVSYDDVDLERLEAERKAELRRQANQTK